MIVSVEGNDVASGLVWQLLSSSAVLMPPPMVVSWAMEDLLVPWTHYVPLQANVTLTLAPTLTLALAFTATATATATVTVTLIATLTPGERLAGKGCMVSRQREGVRGDRRRRALLCPTVC